MRTSTAFVILLALLDATSAGAQAPVPESARQELQKLAKELPSGRQKLAALSATPAPASATALPAPSTTAPFTIGEGFYVEGRLADAVVSMLALMQVRVIPDASASSVANAATLVLSESEVRALIDIGMADLESSDDIENLPHSFADLHAAVADLLPGMSVEELAEAYTRAYEAQPEDLVAQAMMGQPLEPGTRLTRTQIWFLLMDGFAGAAANGARWGTADREVPDLRSPNPQWSAAELLEVIARFPLVTADRLVTVDAPAVISQAAAAGAAPVNVTVRANPSAPPLVSRLTGRTLIPARAGSLTGHEVTWHVRDNSVLREVGTVVSSMDRPMPIGADGTAHFVVQPGVDPTRGTGHVVEDWETVDARFQTRGLVAGAYAVPQPLARMAFGTSRARANVRARWRSPDALYFIVFNQYSGINFDIPGLGGGTRSGLDKLYGKAFKLRNGNYLGWALAEVELSSQVLRGPLGQACSTGAQSFSQQLRVIVTPAVAGAGRTHGFGPTHELDHFVWADRELNLLNTMADEPPDGGYYALELYPQGAPNPAVAPPCLAFIPADASQWGFGGTEFIPFNDAQWTTPGQGYGLATRARGLTSYMDISSWDPLTDDPVTGDTMLSKIKAAFRLTGHSLWIVNIGRTMDELFPK